MGLILLVLIILIPLAGLYLLRANAAPVFLGLCLGYVLLAFDSHNASSVASSIATNNTPIQFKTSIASVNLLLLLGPAVLTILSQIGSVRGHKRYLNLIPSLAVGLFTTLLVVPLLPATTMNSIMTTSYWNQLIHDQATIVGAGSVVAIVFYWFSQRKTVRSKS